MASKKSNPYLENPPSPEEEDVESEEVEDEEPDKDEDEEEPNKKNPEKEPESLDTETESDSHGKYTIKPIGKPPVEEKSAAAGGGAQPGSKPGKGAAVPNNGRKWSYEDEIAILQGIVDYKEQQNKDPSSSHEEFYRFVIGKLSNPEFQKTQVMEKVRRLKEKFKKNLDRSTRGEDPKSFELSQRIWGDLFINSSSLANNNNAKANNHSNYNAATDSKVTGSSSVLALPVRNVSNSTGGSKFLKRARNVEKAGSIVGEENQEDAAKVVKKRKKGGFGELYPHLMSAFEGVDDDSTLLRASIAGGFKRHLSKVDASELEQWNTKWKEVHIAEIEAISKRNELVQEQSKRLFDAMKST